MRGAGTAWIALGAGAVLGMTACAPSEPSDSQPIPVPGTVVVQPGASPMEDDPAVVAARAADLASAQAIATGDLTLSDLHATVTAEEIRAIAGGLRSQISFDAVRVPIGPAVWLPIEIGEPDEAYLPRLGAGGVQIDGCFASGEWFATAEHEPVLRIEDGRSVQYLLTSVDGDLLLAGIVRGGEPCDATGAPVLEFEPALAVPSPITEGSLVLPDDMEERETGAIAER